MTWLIVVISVNAGPPQVVEKIPYEDLRSCQAEKAVRDNRQDVYLHITNGVSVGVSVERKVFCSKDPGAPVG
jgi:hypothetical protein